jgi:PTH1 family peptidyl-tRNA hydrolase
MKLILGLGNPEKKYTNTRHNAGFLVIEKLIAHYTFSQPKLDKKSNAYISKGEINGKRMVMAMPQTYMNNSGLSAQALLSFYKLTPQDLIVIHDDKDIPLGQTRVQTSRGAAGHNGIRSIIEHLGTKDFTRIRVGVAPQEETIHDTASFVLGAFTAAEKKTLSTIIPHITQEIETLVTR